MGNCVEHQETLLNSSKKIEEIGLENLSLLSGLVRYFIEEKEYGAAVKLMKIHDKTNQHYSTNSTDRKQLQQIEEYFEETDRSEIKTSLATELRQVQRANITLKAYFKGFKYTGWWFSKKKANEYISEFELNPRNKETYRYLEREYLRNAKYDGDFEDFVRKINFGEDIPDQYASMIRNICDYTTYVFADQSKRVSYSTYILNQRYSKQLSRYSNL